MYKGDILRLMTDKIEGATISAMNRAAQSAITAASALIRKKYNFKKSELDSQIRMIKATKSRNYVFIIVRNKEIGLIKFSARQIGKPGRSKKGKGPRTKQGVKATVIKGERKLYRSVDKLRGSFIATMRSGHTGVFIRSATETTLNKAGKKTAKIHELYGLRLTSLFSPVDGKSRVVDLIESKFYEVFVKRFQHELRRKGAA